MSYRFADSKLPANKFEKLVYLVGFIIRIYHDAQSSERQTVLAYINSTLLTRTYM